MPDESMPPVSGAQLGAWLAENRESLIRRWLELVVERSTLEELAARPLAERVRELDLLLEAARSEGSGRRGRPDPLVEEALGAALREGGPFALALVAPAAETGPPPQAWAEALAQTSRRDERVIAAADGMIAILLRVSEPEAARVEADRLRAGAWQLLGGSSRLPDVAVALHPQDAVDAAGLVAAARQRLPGPAAGTAGATKDGPEPGTGIPDPADGEVRAERGDGGALRESLRQWADAEGAERSDLWRELAGERPGKGADEGPPAPVTPLYPDTLD